MKLAFAAAALLFAASAAAQQYPSKPIRLVVPLPAGGSIDAIARQFAQKYSEAWSRPVLVENRPGAGTNIGAEAVAKAAPDGYTWLMNSTAQAISAALYKNLAYDPERDLAPVSALMGNVLVFVVANKVPAQSMKEMIALLRAQPGEVAFGTTGIGSGGHLAIEMLLQSAGVKALHVPYKGDAGLFPGLIAGDVAFALAPTQSAVAHIRAGRVRALAVSTAKRTRALPEVPTIAEATGLDYDYEGWTSLFTTAGTPREVLLRIAGETAKILRMPDIQKSMDGWGVEPFELGVDEFSARYRADIAAFRKVVREANIRVE